ncbi:MAG: hypothetical protein IGR76_16090 [Synechococcales cyanobacterium T60_A2020_003]|nr:hypothetical protein [Synechococcales cyanobacterium T60_A2020_003]
MNTPTLYPTSTLAQSPSGNLPGAPKLWMTSTGVLAVLLIGLGVYGKLKFDKLAKEKRFEELKNRDLQKKLRLALQTISKMERNPDLIHSREFNLDYLRMRMDEDQFRFQIINQLKIKVKERISVALRAAPAGNTGVVGIAGSGGKQIDEIFDVEYRLHDQPKSETRVLFRVQIKMTKLPTQATSATVSQIVDCLEQFMSPEAEEDNWQPVIQNRIASLHWDQKAKPTPLLVLEQSNDGANVTYRTKRMVER